MISWAPGTGRASGGTGEDETAEALARACTNDLWTLARVLDGLKRQQAGEAS
jgi:hypothetical protein